jgi:hypothetical protein
MRGKIARGSGGSAALERERRELVDECPGTLRHVAVRCGAPSWTPRPGPGRLHARIGASRQAVFHHRPGPAPLGAATGQALTMGGEVRIEQ